MPISLTSRGRDMFALVEVRDPTGQRRIKLGRLSSSTTVAEVRARALSQLRLPEQVEWNLRCDRTGRLLNDQQQLGNVTVDGCTRAELSLQPEAALG